MNDEQKRKPSSNEYKVESDSIEVSRNAKGFYSFAYKHYFDGTKKEDRESAITKIQNVIKKLNSIFKADE